MHYWICYAVFQNINNGSSVLYAKWLVNHEYFKRLTRELFFATMAVL
jgi:hypothetical protein